MTPISLFWHRRDLRITDNRGLAAALDTDLPVLGFFCFDKTILDVLPKVDARVGFIHTELDGMATSYRSAGSQLIARHGVPLEEIQSLRQALQSAGYDLRQIHTNRDYAVPSLGMEKCRPGAKEGIGPAHDDHVILPPEAVLKDDGTPYTVFTPYSRKWHKVLDAQYGDPLAEAMVTLDGRGITPFPEEELPSLSSMGFDEASADPSGWAAFDGRQPDADVLHR